VGTCSCRDDRCRGRHVILWRCYVSQGWQVLDGWAMGSWVGLQAARSRTALCLNRATATCPPRTSTGDTRTGMCHDRQATMSNGAGGSTEHGLQDLAAQYGRMPLPPQLLTQPQSQLMTHFIGLHRT
jgi:hypothetical protein